MSTGHTTHPAPGIQPPEFRLPELTRIGRVRLQIADLDRSIAYYTDVIGLRLFDRDDVDGARSARLGPVGEDRVLLELREQPGARRVPRGRLLGLYHFAILLPSRDDLGRFLRHTSELGIRVGAAEHGISEALYLTDPDGITVEVYRDRPRSEWPVTDGEIEAVSVALDTRGLLLAAGDEQWRGAPAGTTIGHVHFYIGDIPRAEAFYHAALGFAKTIWSVPTVLFVAAGGYHHHVGLNTWAAGSPVATEQDARLLDWELVLPEASDVEAAWRSLETNGYLVNWADGVATATDPWGLTVRVTPA